MSKASFGASRNAQPENPPAETPGAETPGQSAATAIEKAPERALAEPIGNQDFSGNWDREDVRLPRINLIHKTSDNALIKAFGIGSFAFDKTVKLSDGETPLVVTALRAAKDYIQKLPYGSKETPAVFKTPEEVTQSGGSLNYKDVDSGNFFGPRAHIQFVVAMPEGTGEEGEALFPYEFNGTAYGMAIMTVSSSAYTSVGKELATLSNNNKVMRKGLRFGKLLLTSDVRRNTKNSWHIPVIKYAGENPAELVKFFEGLL
jgi:hypothetical protein